MPGYPVLYLEGLKTIMLKLSVSYFSADRMLLLMDKILHDPKDPKLWELWYIPYNG